MHESLDVRHLAVFDTDGALQETAERVNHSTRRSLLRGTGALALGGSALAKFAPVAWAQSQGDIDILNYALTLEYLEAAFYKEANASGALNGQVARFSQVTGEHEDQHVQTLRKTLGSKAVKKPSFDFKGTTENQDKFTATAIVLEDTGVRAYQGQAGNIKSDDVLKAAISIHPVEARHAAWIRNIVGQPPAPDAFNPADDMATVLAAVKGTGFITSNATARSGSPVSGRPSVTG